MVARAEGRWVVACLVIAGHIAAVIGLATLEPKKRNGLFEPERPGDRLTVYFLELSRAARSHGSILNKPEPDLPPPSLIPNPASISIPKILLDDDSERIDWLREAEEVAMQGSALSPETRALGPRSQDPNAKRRLRGEGPDKSFGWSHSRACAHSGSALTLAPSPWL